MSLTRWQKYMRLRRQLLRLRRFRLPSSSGEADPPLATSTVERVVPNALVNIRGLAADYCAFPAALLFQNRNDLRLDWLPGDFNVLI